MPDETLSALVRRVDEDRWLASRFAPEPVRKRLEALYAVNHEIARTADVVREAALGDIRLQWWREAIAEIADGKPARAHPALLALQETWGALPALHDIEALISARARDLDAGAFADWAALEAYVDATAGGVLRLALIACDPDAAAQSQDFAEAGGRAWAYVGLARSGRAVMPPNALREDLLRRADLEFARARAEARRAPPAVFAAIGYLALVPGYLRALRNGGAPSLITRQLRIVAAAATGRL